MDRLAGLHAIDLLTTADLLATADLLTTTDLLATTTGLSVGATEGVSFTRSLLASSGGSLLSAG